MRQEEGSVAIKASNKNATAAPITITDCYLEQNVSLFQFTYKEITQGLWGPLGESSLDKVGTTGCVSGRRALEWSKYVDFGPGKWLAFPPYRIGKFQYNNYSFSFSFPQKP